MEPLYIFRMHIINGSIEIKIIISKIAYIDLTRAACTHTDTACDGIHLCSLFEANPSMPIMVAKS